MAAPTSTVDPEFLDEAQRIFLHSDRVLVLVRYAYGAGSKNFILLNGMEQFRGLLNGLRRRDSVIILKSFQVVREGSVDHAFIEASLSVFRPNSSWILIGPDNFEYTSDWAYAESASELKEELADRLGNKVCIIDEPNYLSDEDSIDAYVPDEDGVVRPGAY